MTFSFLKMKVMIAVFAVLVVSLARAQDKQEGLFVRGKDTGAASMDARRLGRNLPGKNGNGGGGRNRDEWDGNDRDECPGDTCLNIDQRRAFFDTFWWQSYLGDDLRKLKQDRQETTSEFNDHRKLPEDDLFDPACREFKHFNHYVCPCEHDACDPLFSSYDYCADYLALGERFGDNLSILIGNTGPPIDPFKGCVGFVEECCDYPRYCCETSCLNKRALCDLYQSAVIEESTGGRKLKEESANRDEPQGMKGDSEIEDNIEEHADERNLGTNYTFDCGILAFFGKDLCPCELYEEKEPSPWEPNPWEKDEVIKPTFCDYTAPNCRYCEMFVEQCCNTTSTGPPYYALPYYYDDDDEF